MIVVGFCDFDCDCGYVYIVYRLWGTLDVACSPCGWGCVVTGGGWVWVVTDGGWLLSMFVVLMLNIKLISHRILDLFLKFCTDSCFDVNDGGCSFFFKRERYFNYQHVRLSLKDSSN